MRHNIVKWTVPTFHVGNQPKKDRQNFKKYLELIPLKPLSLVPKKYQMKEFTKILEIVKILQN